MKKLLNILLVLVLALSLALPALAEEAEAPAPQIVDAKVITYVTDEARTVAAVRIEYDQPITTGTYGLSDYFVNGYDVRAVYVSDTGVYQEAARTGNYVIVEFAISQVPGYSEGKMNFWTTDNSYIDPTLDVYCPGDDCWFTTTGCIHFEADDYIAGSVTSEGGVETLYRLYIPEGYEAADESLEDLPLVVWLHGGGESGTDNEEQLLANRGALNFSSKEAQAAHPCFVLAPQTNVGWADDALVNVNTIVLDLIANYNIDASRIYGIGCSWAAWARAAWRRRTRICWPRLCRSPTTPMTTWAGRKRTVPPTKACRCSTSPPPTTRCLPPPTRNAPRKSALSRVR